MFYVVVDASVLLLVIHNEDQSAAAARGAPRQAHPSCKIQCKMGIIAAPILLPGHDPRPVGAKLHCKPSQAAMVGVQVKSLLA